MVQLCQLCCADPTLHSKLFRVVTYHRSNTTAASTSCEKKLDGMLSGGKVVVKASFFPHAHIQCMHLGSYFQGKRRRWILKVRIFYIFKQEFFQLPCIFSWESISKMLERKYVHYKNVNYRTMYWLQTLGKRGMYLHFCPPPLRTHACPYKQTVV